MYSFGPKAHYLPVNGIISWCLMCRLLQTSDSANFLLKFRLFVRLCSIHSPLGCEYKIWNYEGLNLRSDFVTRFVDPVVNTGILNKSDIIFVDESNKIRYSYLLLLSDSTPSSEDLGVTFRFTLATMEFQIDKFILINCKFRYQVLTMNLHLMGCGQAEASNYIYKV